MPDELSWVERLASGDEQALVAIYDRYQGRIYRFAMQMTGDLALAQDVTQEVFLSLLRKPTAYDPERGSLASFLFAVARNQVLKRLRGEGRYVELDDGRVEAAAIEPASLSTADTAGVRQAVVSLPSDYREVVVLCEFQGMSYREAAHVLDTPIGTVRSRLHRARALLAKKLVPRAERAHSEVRS